ncbi:transposase [Gluconacetobacter liquefaciens NRIC 0522]|nr:transposase [Gluconacetobacter liquefaciens NRIC 0522]
MPYSKCTFGGLSHRQAAERFGVSPASAIRWCTLARETGSATPKPRGGDRLSGRIEAQAARIRALIDEKDDLTLVKIRAQLAEEGHHFSVGTLWRFFARHWITWKKTAHAAEQDRPDVLNPVRKHAKNEMLSPVEFEQQQILNAQGV